MSFMGGPDCGPVNPLQSLLKSQEQDASVQRDRFQQIPAAGISNGASMRTQHAGSMGPMTQADLDREMQQFSFGLPGQMHAGPSAGPANAFAMEAMQRELAQSSQSTAGPAQGPSESAWAKEFPNARGASPSVLNQNPAWRQAFLSQNGPQQTGTSQQMPASMQQMPASMQHTMPMAYQSQMPTYNPMFMQQQPHYSPQYQRPPEMASTVSKGKSRFVELDDKTWEAEFARLDDSKMEQQDVAHVPDAFVNGETVDPAEVPDESDAQFLASLEHTWKNLKDTLDSSQLNDQELAAWEAQYGTSLADLDGGDYEYNTGINPFNPAEFDKWLKDATSQPYPFVKEEENTYIQSFDPFAEGQRLLREGHPLAEAALAFEAACRQNEHRGEAWKALGETLAADEKELKAIKALERAVACPDDGGEGAWMSLAISYVNEGQDMRAFATLEKWITRMYPGASQTGLNPSANNADPWSTQSKIVEQFLNAARTGPVARSGGNRDAGAMVDADVQSGLGVLYYTASDYARARDCFEAALGARPDDFLLWNRLGATLANGGQPEEAIEAYRKALELRPTFTRAIYNLGVSCLNINCFHEAAEHLLAALELHRKDQLVGKGKGPEKNDALGLDDGSENLWSTLRRAFMCMERQDLADRAHPGGDVDSFRREGFEF